MIYVMWKMMINQRIQRVPNFRHIQDHFIYSSWLLALWSLLSGMKPAKWDEPCKISVGIFSFAVWRSDWGTRRRGWCRAEMWCKLLSERSKVPIVATRRLMQWENPRNTGYPQIIHFRFRIFHEINPPAGESPTFRHPKARSHMVRPC